MRKAASFVSAVFFWLIALVHVVRMALRVQLTLILGDWRFDLPLWTSVLPVGVFGILGAWLWVERRQGAVS